MSKTTNYYFVGIPGFTYVSKTPLHIDEVSLSVKVGAKSYPVYSKLTRNSNSEDFTPLTEIPNVFTRTGSNKENIGEEFFDVCEQLKEDEENIYKHHISRKQELTESVQNLPDYQSKLTYDAKEQNCFGFVLLHKMFNVDIIITFKLYSYIKDSDTGDIVCGESGDGTTKIYLGDWVTKYNPYAEELPDVKITVAGGSFCNQYTDINKPNDNLKFSITVPKPIGQKNVNINNILDYQSLLNKTKWQDDVSDDKKVTMPQENGLIRQGRMLKTTYTADSDIQYLSFMIDQQHPDRRRGTLNAISNKFTGIEKYEDWSWCRENAAFSIKLPWRLLGAVLTNSWGNKEVITRIAGYDSGLVDPITRKNIILETLNNQAYHLPFLFMTNISSHEKQYPSLEYNGNLFNKSKCFNDVGWKYLYKNEFATSNLTASITAILTYYIDKSTTDGLLKEKSGVNTPQEMDKDDIFTGNNVYDYFLIGSKSEYAPILAPKVLDSTISGTFSVDDFNRITSVPTAENLEKTSSSDYYDQICSSDDTLKTQYVPDLKVTVGKSGKGNMTYDVTNYDNYIEVKAEISVTNVSVDKDIDIKITGGPKSTYILTQAPYQNYQLDNYYKQYKYCTVSLDTTITPSRESVEFSNKSDYLICPCLYYNYITSNSTQKGGVSVLGNSSVVQAPNVVLVTTITLKNPSSKCSPESTFATSTWYNVKNGETTDIFNGEWTCQEEGVYAVKITGVYFKNEQPNLANYIVTLCAGDTTIVGLTTNGVALFYIPNKIIITKISISSLLESSYLITKGLFKVTFDEKVTNSIKNKNFSFIEDEDTLQYVFFPSIACGYEIFSQTLNEDYKYDYEYVHIPTGDPSFQPIMFYNLYKIKDKIAKEYCIKASTYSGANDSPYANMIGRTVRVEDI